MTLLQHLQHGAFLAVLGFASSALAQDTSGGLPVPEGETDDKPAHDPGKGFYSGNYHLMPGATVTTFFDSNVFRTSPGDTENTVTTQSGSGVLRLSAAIIGQRRRTSEQNNFEFQIGAGYDQFLSGDGSVRNLSGLDASLVGKYHYQPKGKVSFLLQNDFERAVTPRTIRVSEGGSLVPTFRQDTDRLLVATRLRPQGGALEQQMAYTGELHVFESSEFATANHIKHSVSTYTKWNFLPRTAALFQASLGYNDFFQDINQNPFGNVDSVPLRVTMGAIGLIGSRIQFAANLGYGNSFHRATPGTPEDISFSSLIGSASARFNLADRDVFTAAYAHDFGDSLFGNFITRDSLDLSLAHAFNPRLQGLGLARVSVDRFSNIPNLEDQEAIQDSRTDFPIMGMLGVDYLVRSDLKVGGNLSAIANITDFTVRDLNTGGLNEAGYLVVQAGVVASYTY